MYTPDSEPNLVVHERRPQWGVGLVTKTSEERMEVQFQDGKLRSFKKGFLHLLVPAPEGQQSEAVVEELMERFGTSLAVLNEQRRQGEAEPLMTFTEQVRVFKKIYPGGFQDEAYENSVRSDPEGRRLKRLREPAMEYAQIHLAKAAMDEMIAEGAWEAIHDATIRVLRKTSLASPSTVVDPIRDIDPETYERFARALYGLLWGEDEPEVRFKEFLGALEAGGPIKLTWPMASVLPALVHPDKYITIRRKVFEAQARTVTPNRTYRSAPAPRSYVRYHRMAEKVQDRLTEAGLKPRDMMDIYQFIWETLRPKGQEILSDMQSRS